MMIKVSLFYLRLPLHAPYHLSFGSVSYYDTFILLLRDDKKQTFSEVTALPGYSPEKPGGIWRRATHWLEAAAGSSNKLFSAVKKNADNYPFSATLFNVSWEKYLGFFGGIKETEIPLVGTISTSVPEDASREAENLLEREYKTIKLKIKGDVEKDLTVIAAVQSILKKHAVLRLDANQSYLLGDCMRLLESVDPEGIEILEQPLSKSDWGGMRELRKVSQIPLMLDESIWTQDDIRKAHTFKSGDFVKLKVFKHGSLSNTLDMIHSAKDMGLKVILGNGAQTDVGCADEALLYGMGKLESAAECNGFLKQKFMLLRNSISATKDGFLFRRCGEIDSERLAKYSIGVFSSELCMDTI